MIRSALFVLSMVVCLAAAAAAAQNPSVPAKAPSADAEKKSITLFDFERPDIMKDRNVTFGTWELHPSYTAEVSIVKPLDKKESESRGAVLMIDYDVSVPERTFPRQRSPSSTVSGSS